MGTRDGTDQMRASSESASHLGPGSVIANRYRLEAPIGRGGFGVVYRATQRGLERPVALKLLLPEATAGSERRRFEHEARLAQRLTHPNTVRILDFGESDDGTPFIAWELLNGLSLDALLRAQ